MGMGCGMSMVKYILFVFNLLCALGGVAILGIGIAYLVRIADESIEKLFEQWNVQVVPIVFIVIGAIIFIVAFFGCCGAIKESHCMTVTYSTFLMIMLLAQIALAIVVFVYVGDLQESVGRFLERVWTDRDTNRPFWDSTQQALQCCGLDNSGQWGGVLPISCCAQGASQCTANQAFNVGCREAANSFINSSGNIIAAVALGVAGIELIGFIFACCLANNIRNQSRRSPYQ